ncbi:DapH/DapD/GlmU-related protein [Pseudoflavonifractor sp. MSJ-37]|uniref:DapH/DapD/GlmU-related protein n=1 Tax=Pseudoflavonifractor sp. MSJ-37 TaxID=2841531 RepID=UPI00209CBB5D|nr:DapH/DapD/GlmU-related protein [Pseudoflavonifractor sp. MSJ-37]
MMETVGAIVFLAREGNGRPLMMEPLLFDPAARWLEQSLERSGVERFLVVCRQEDREPAEACFPLGTVFVTTGTEDARERLLAFLEDHSRVIAVTRPVFMPAYAEDRVRAAQAELPPQEKNAMLSRGDHPTSCGVFEFTEAGRSALAAGSDIQEALRAHCRPYESCFLPLEEDGLDAFQITAKEESIARLKRDGVRFLDPASAFVGPGVTVGGGTLILPGVILRGAVKIGAGCELGPNTMIRDCTVGDGVTVNASQLNESTVESGAKIGPFAYIRPNCHVGHDVKVGDFVELKNSSIGDGTKISHLTYVGDSDVGGHVNFGCGTVTVNYDGTSKFRTTIGDNAFIGCNTNLVAPVKIGDGAYTAAGSTITDDVPADSLAIARSVQVVKKQWAARRRSRRK